MFLGGWSWQGQGQSGAGQREGDDRGGRGEEGGLESLFQRGWEVEVKETEEE